MKLALLAPECSPSWGGVGSYTFNLVNNLPKDVDVHIITIDRSINDSYENLLLNKGIEIHKVTKVSPNDSFFYNLKFQLALFTKIKKINDNYNFDLIHSHSGHLPHYLSQFWNVAPMIVTVHTETKGWRAARNLIRYKKARTEMFSDLFAPFISFGEKTTFKRADRLLPISKFTLKQINQAYGVDTASRAEVVYNGVDSKLFKPKDNVEKNKEVTISFFGRFISIKGLEIFLKALKLVKKEGYSIKILLGGRGNKDYLEKFLPSLKHDVQFLGRVNYQDMPILYNQSDIIVVPSLYEGCSGVILEAMACQKVVVASDVGGTPEIIKNGHNGLLFKSRDFNQLAHKIISILEETEDVNSIRKNARKTILDRFDWKQKGIEIYENYLKVLGLL